MTCPTCRSVAFFEALECAQCLTPLGFHAPSTTMSEVRPAGVPINGRTWVACSNRGWGCNWLLADDEGSGRCAACRLIRRQPDADDTMAWEKLADTAVDLRRLLVQLDEIGLPVVGWHEREGGLGFDLLSSRTANTPVLIGHANGIITIDLVESLADHRESIRVRLGEPYRTMLGHFRHEVGHYYEWILVESAGDATLLESCRRLFGDERASYTDALDRHYRLGPPADWQTTYISEYATMHPWEDFAECFAHYLHIQGTLATAASAGLVLKADRVPQLLTEDVEPGLDYGDRTVDQILDDWRVLAIFFNRVNRAMGHADLYPFTIPDPVTRKLAFVHRVIGSVRS
ncbi:zinc-binding metallopeptidase family protein [Nocardioides sp. URHA0020]|uniref:zinc-binding metallopeptidase family protein n=1 Tax=Nocardioides sp. URHA0020 TaxID=1380392 RepID=UPI00056D6382|nr:putative zinc-binding metallopeptidase [Nocardioides sp. URHA0020]